MSAQVQNRGLRNNNPGNIRISNLKWQGKVPREKNTDKAFEQFTTMALGIRALIKVLEAYYTRYNLNTIRKILNRYAPSSENDTDGYVRNVAKWTGLGPDVAFTWTHDNINKLVNAIIRQETSINVAPTIWQDAWALATGQKKNPVG